jgi:hypothetical protein
MTEQYEHIFETHRQYAHMGDEERKNWICQDRWVDLPQAKHALAVLEKIFVYPPRGRMPCLLLYGATDMGKSEILKRFVQQHPRGYDKRRGVSHVPVVRVEMVPEPLEADFYLQILTSINHAGCEHYAGRILRTTVHQILKEIDATMLILDEIEKMLAGTPRQQRIFLNVIRFLTNSLEIPIVCAGTETARMAFATDPGLADRFGVFELNAWQNDTAFRQLLVSLAGLLPLRKPSKIDTPEVRKQILAMTEGITGRIFKLMEVVAMEAIDSKKEMLDLSSFMDPNLQLPLLSMQLIEESKGSRRLH